MYRALTLKVLEKGIEITDTKSIINLAVTTSIDLVNNPDTTLSVFLDGRDVSSAIRQPVVTRFVSDVAKIKDVRNIMAGLQRNLGSKGSAVLDGRDIGTVVFPDAEKKFYVDADFKERVRRRHKELNCSDQTVSLESVSKDLSNRDTIDSNREIAPLKKAEDAIYVDTTDLSIEEVVERLLKWINP